jgi:hypothetical protein
MREGSYAERDQAPRAPRRGSHSHNQIQRDPEFWKTYLRIFAIPFVDDLELELRGTEKNKRGSNKSPPIIQEMAIHQPTSRESVAMYHGPKIPQISEPPQGGSLLLPSICLAVHLCELEPAERFRHYRLNSLKGVHLERYDTQCQPTRKSSSPIDKRSRYIHEMIPLIKGPLHR